MQAETFIHPLIDCRAGRRARAGRADRPVHPYWTACGDRRQCRDRQPRRDHGRHDGRRRHRIFPQAALGGLPQNAKHKGGRTTLVIGANCIIREGVTMHIGTDTSRGETKVGDNGNFLAYTHVAHDCIVGKNATFANGATLAGHCRDRRQRHHRRADGHPSVRADRRQRIPVRLLGDPRRRHSVRHRARQPCQAARPQHHRHAAVGTAARRNPRGAARLSRRVRSGAARSPRTWRSPRSSSPVFRRR